MRSALTLARSYIATSTKLTARTAEFYSDCRNWPQPEREQAHALRLCDAYAAISSLLSRQWRLKEHEANTHGGRPIENELACCSPRLRLHSLQFPFQPLQGSVNFIGSNRSLALVTVAGVHEHGDVLQPFLNKVEVLS